MRASARCVTLLRDGGGPQWGHSQVSKSEHMFFDEISAIKCEVTYPWLTRDITRRLAVKVGDVYHPLGEPFVKPA